MKNAVAVLTASLALGALARLSSQAIPQDTGAAGAWQRIQKLKTTASVLHGTAHPDDEHGGVLAKLSRGDGARVILLTLTRGESGDNAIGPQLFDALGLIRTDELLTADQLLRRRRAVLLDDRSTTGFPSVWTKRPTSGASRMSYRDVVRVIRMDAAVDRCFHVFKATRAMATAIIQTAGVLSQQASEAAGDPQQFPEQIAEGLRPWSPFKVYMGGVRGDENWTLRHRQRRVQPGARRLLREHRGVRPELSAIAERRAIRSSRSARLLVSTRARRSRVTAPDRRALDLRRHRYDLRGPVQDARPHGARRRRLDAGRNRRRRRSRNLDIHVHRSVRRRAPALAEGLRLTRDVMAKSEHGADVLHVLRIKERQFQDAISAALGLELSRRPIRTEAESVRSEVAFTGHRQS